MKYLYQLPKIITLSGVVVFAIVKFYLRELNIPCGFFRFVLNVYPNFLAGLMIPLLFLYKYELLPKEKMTMFDIKIKLIMGATLIFLIFEEYRPTFGSSKTFDYWDMIFSGIGLIIFYMVYRILKTNRQKQTCNINENDFQNSSR